MTYIFYHIKLIQDCQQKIQTVILCLMPYCTFLTP